MGPGVLLVNKPIKPKTCRNCRDKFQPWNSMQIVCSVNCVIKYTEKKKEAKLKKQHAKQKRDFYANDRKLRAKEAQKAFNAFIRKRDEGQACISCQRSNDVKKNAGHYKSVGSSPELRFEELNCHLQCEHCNSFKSGNIESYRANLINKIGSERVDWLEGPHELKKYSCEDLKEIEQLYKQKLKELLLSLIMS